MPEQLRVGIVGTGTMGAIHGRVIDSYHRSRVSAWTSRKSAEALDFDTYDAPVFGSVEEMVASGQVDAVVVATPDHLHAGPSLAAIAGGCSVLVEKPLATTVEDARAIRDAAKAAAVTAMTLYNHRWAPSYWQAHDISRDGQLGSPVVAYARKNDSIVVPTEVIPWAAQTTPSFLLSSHDLDLLLWYFQSSVVEVFATAVHGVLQARGIDTPDAVQAHLRFANGAVGTLEACWIYPDTFPTVIDSFVELIFSDGVIHLDRKHEQIEVATKDRFSYPRNTLSNRIAGKPSGAATAAVQHFIDAVIDGVEPVVTIDSSVHVTEVLVAIDEAWRTGRPVAPSGAND